MHVFFLHAGSARAVPLDFWYAGRGSFPAKILAFVLHASGNDGASTDSTTSPARVQAWFDELEENQTVALHRIAEI